VKGALLSTLAYVAATAVIGRQVLASIGSDFRRLPALHSGWKERSHLRRCGDCLADEKERCGEANRRVLRWQGAPSHVNR
jgi:hypothetical protein